jgi:uncharacterized membrane protein HdeD (DUF308 family)
MQINSQYMAAFGKNWLWFFIWGIALMALGIIAVGATYFTTLLTVVAIGFLIFFAGAVALVDTVTFWWGKWSGFFWHLIGALLYLGVGAMLINSPIEGAISITFILGIFYIVMGAFRMALSFSMQLPRWKWMLFNGVISFVLGILIINNWPASSLFIIGLFVGIDLFFWGWAYDMAALAAKNISQR